MIAPKLALILALAVFGSGLAQAQLGYGISLGAGLGQVSQDFTSSGSPVKLSYAAPGLRLAGEIGEGPWYLDMSLNILFSPSQVSLGGLAQDLSGYATSIALDFTAVSIGYLVDLGSGLRVGGALGFHVAAPSLYPADEGNPSLLALEGNYGLLGISLVPTARYDLGHGLRLSLCLPLGLDFGAMTEEVVIGGVGTGVDSPAIVRPSTLKPVFTGYSIGAYLTIGYFSRL